MLEYSQIVRKKLKILKGKLTEQYGEEFAKKKLGEISARLRQLEEFGESGIRVAEQYDVETDYYLIFVNHNYFVYRIETTKVIIVQMFSEKEDFMKKLFGLSGRTQEFIDYWGIIGSQTKG